MPFTVVFDGDIKKWDGNPFDVETPFGKPYAVAVGDALEELDRLKSAAFTPDKRREDAIEDMVAEAQRMKLP